MIIKSHIRGGYRSAADYMKAQGKNEKIRTVEISDTDAADLDEAFQNMWKVASNSRATKPLHHISINPFKDERLTDAQVLKIVERCEKKYGYKPDDHQRVIVEHIRDGRQHFHVIWNRVSLATGRVTKSGEHWKKSKQAAREMEKELGLKRPTPRRVLRMRAASVRIGRTQKIYGRYSGIKPLQPIRIPRVRPLPPKPMFQAVMRMLTRRQHKQDENIPDSEKMPVRRSMTEAEELLAWAWENKRFDILALFGIILPLDYFEP